MWNHRSLFDSPLMLSFYISFVVNLTTLLHTQAIVCDVRRRYINELSLYCSVQFWNMLILWIWGYRIHGFSIRYTFKQFNRHIYRYVMYTIQRRQFLFDSHGVHTERMIGEPLSIAFPSLRYKLEHVLSNKNCPETFFSKLPNTWLWHCTEVGIARLCC